jgi:hypothetical protein
MKRTFHGEHIFYITVPRVGAKAMIMGPGTILGVKMWKNLKKHSEGKKTLVITGTTPIDR